MSFEQTTNKINIKIKNNIIKKNANINVKVINVGECKFLQCKNYIDMLLLAASQI